MENLLDYFLDFVHLFLIFFNLFGWISKKTRVYNLICLLATLSCWFIVGLWYGIGYCPLTDYHWKVKAQLGHENLPPSYIKYLLDGIFSTNFSSRFIEILTMSCTALSFILSVYLNIRDKFIKK
ncbi:MAG: DUF2784 family protein [Bdellovibrionota bacterium]|nr:DUF2784 family protein [Bdellovibrionota bacterium]